MEYKNEINICETLKVRADLTPSKVAFSFLSDVEEEKITYGELYHDALKIGSHLKNKVSKGERVVLCFPNGLNFIKAFFGCLFAGVIGVPSYPPRMNRSGERLKSIIDDCEPKFILTSNSSAFEKLFSSMSIQVPIIKIEDCFIAEPLVQIDYFPIAFLQYTSGSTGTPKGVKVTHQNIVSNQELLGEVFELGEKDVLVGWLPFFHDMGLIGNILNTVHTGYTAYLMTPVSFLKNPVSWLKNISKYKATVSGGPNFAYQLCTEKILEKELVGIDLSSWKVAFNGAETVKPSTLRAFSKTFSSTGFDYKAFLPCYGMAETTLIVSGAKRGCSVIIENFSKDRIAFGESDFNNEIQEHVSCGPILEGYQYKFVDELGVEQPSGIVGELCLKGDSVTPGYWKGHNESFLTDGFFLTGDLGFLREGQLFITGRQKDVVIINGKNYYPTDFEIFVEANLKKTIANGTAVFGVEIDNKEGLVFIIEYPFEKSFDYNLISSELKQKLAKEFNLLIHDILLIRKGTGLRTTSGKVQRKASKKAYLNNQFTPFNSPSLKRGINDSVDKDKGIYSNSDQKVIDIIEKYIGNSPIKNPQKSIFEFGIDSIKIIQLIEELNRALNLNLSADLIYEFDTLDKILLLIDNPVSHNLKTAADIEIVNATDLQKSIWLYQSKKPNSTGYNIPIWFNCSKRLIRGDLEGFVNDFIQNNLYLKSNFTLKNGQLKSVINSDSSCHFETIKSNENLNSLIVKLSTQKIDLESGSLLKVYLIEQEKENIVFVLAHHILLDGKSIQELTKIFKNNIGRLEKGKKYKIERRSCSFRDYCKSYEESNTNYKRDFWHKYLEDFRGDIQLPILSNTSQKGKSVMFNIAPDLSKKILIRSKEINVNQYSVVLSAYFIFLQQLTGSKDLLVGIPISTRLNEDFSNIFGLFLNNGFIRKRFLPNQSKTDFIKDIYESSRSVIRNSSYNLYEDEELIKRNNSGKYSFSSIFFNYLDFAEDEDVFNVYKENPGVDLNFDLNLYCVKKGGDFSFKLDYLNSNFSKKSIEQVIVLFNKTLSVLLNNNEKLEFPTISLLNKDITLQSNIVNHPWEVFEKSVTANPNATSLIVETKSYTRKEVLENSLKISSLIQDNSYSGNVGILIGHNEKVIFSQLGILHSGNSFVILDPFYPQERLNAIVKDADIGFILYESEQEILKIDTEEIGCVNINKSSNNEAQFIKSNIADLAYILYTSGSTGQPKGVMQSYGYISHIAQSFGESINIKESDCLSLISVFSFSASIMDVYGALLNGASLKIIDIKKGVNHLIKAVSSQVSIFHSVPTIFRECLTDTGENSKELKNIRTVYLAGEKLLEADISLFKINFKNNSLLVNGLGCTEYNICSQSFLINDLELDTNQIDLGYDGLGVQVLLLDEKGEEVENYQEGEIVLKGNALSLGYWKNETLNSSRFSEIDGTRIFKTGDMGRRMPDGRLKSIGRNDFQIKLNGQRIELGEIETAINGIKEIEVSVVDLKNQSDLVCFYKGDLDELNIRGYLANKLPSYMIPTLFIKVEDFPKTTSGKIDRRSLKLDEAKKVENKYKDIDKRWLPLQSIWEEVFKLNGDLISNSSSFFELGGNSLQCLSLISRVKSKFNAEISIVDLFRNPTFDGCIILIEQSVQTDNKNIIVIEPSDFYTISGSQRRLWVLSQFEEASFAYNMPGVFELEGDLNIEAFKASFDLLIDRHESLRTVFIESQEGDVYQVIKSISELGFVVKQVNNSERKIKDLIENELAQRFDLANGPLLRACLFQTDVNKYVFTFVIHHIISDGWSLGVLIRDLLTIYNAKANSEPIPLLPLRIHYKDFAAWQFKQFQGEVQTKNKEYWINQFKGELPVLALPSDYSRPLVKTYNGNLLRGTINKTLTNQLTTLTKENGATLFMGLLSLVNALFYRYTGQEDIVIGSPISGRDHVELENQIGFYVNTLALRTKFQGSDSFNQLLENIKEVTLGAYEHQTYPFDELVDELMLSRDMSRNPLFDVMVVLQNNDTSTSEQTLGNVKVSPYEEGEHTVSKFDMTYNFIEVDNGEIALSIEYNTDIYSEQMMNQMSNHLIQLLEEIVENPNRSINELDYLSKKEKNQLLFEFNDTAVDYPKDETIIQLFEEQIEKTPDNIAVVFEEVKLTYKELNEKANQLGHYLLSTYDIEPDDLIGIKLDRSEQMIIAILGILKSGGAYVPIDPEYPEGRINHIEEDSNCKVVIDEKELSLISNSQPITKPNISTKSTDLAYVIYTSGSTGKPKGVAIENKNTTSFLNWSKDEFNVNAFEEVFGVTSICFDLSVYEIFFTLSIGKTLRLLANGLSIPKALEKTKSKVLINTVPSVIKSLLEQSIDLSKVSVLNMAGEPIPQWFLKDLLFYDLEIRNLYGPSEDTTYSTIYRIKEDCKILIGRPISNTKLYVLGDNNDLLPMGSTGEICLSGLGLARGYLNKEQLTQEKFISHPFIEGERLYKTGDLGRWLVDGNIEFIGRKDDQVKIRGYRIELGEIESNLLSIENINQAIVLVKLIEEDKQELVSYIKGNNLSISKLRNELEKILPSYMIPSYFVELEEFPLTPNGKVDKKALPNSEGLGMMTGVEYIAPRNEIEQKIVEIWSKVLGIPKQEIGINDTFFDLGGNSLNIVQISSHIQRKFNMRLDYKTIFEKPSVKIVGEEIKKIQWTLDDNKEVNEELESFKI